MRISLFPFTVILTALALAGCGDSEGGGNGDATAGTVTAAGGAESEAARIRIDSKAEFIEVANDLCAERRGQIRSAAVPILKEDPNRATDVVAEELVSQAVAPGLEEEVDSIRALDTPAGESQQVDAILAATEQAIDEARSDPSAFANKDRPFARSEELADEYGLSACGGP